MNHKGITLIELLVVIMIVGILAAVAVPIYTNYMIRARRSDAKTTLEQVRAAQEMWRAERGCYAQNGVDCQGNASAGTAETKLITTMGVPSTTINTYYTWNFSVKTGTTFTAQAVPQGSQAKDPGGTLLIDQNGTKSSTKGGKTWVYPDSNCAWTK